MDLSRQATEILERLFKGGDLTSFLDCNYTEVPLHLADGFDPSCFGFNDFDALIRMPGLLEQRRMLLRAEGSHDVTYAANVAQVYEAISRGESVQLVGLQEILPDSHPVIRIYRAVEEFLQAPGRGITVFFAPPGEQSLPIHHDVYEVFTLQFDGTKTWQLYDFVPPNYAQGGHYETGAPTVFQLAPGDALYMPMSQVHHVLRGEGLSLSAALVFDPRTWLSLLSQLRDDLSTDPLFWRSIFPGDAESGAATRRDALRAAVDRLDTVRFADELKAERATRIPGLPGSHILAATDIAAIGPETSLIRRPGPRPIVEILDGKPRLITPNADPVEAPPDAEAAFRLIAATDGPFRPKDICVRLSDSSKLAIVCKLVRKGIITRWQGHPKAVNHRRNGGGYS